MKRYNKIPFLLLMIVIAANSMQSQNLITGATGNIGFSKVTSNLPISGDYKVQFTMSGNLGMFIEKKVGQKSSLGVEALWVQIEGKEVTENKTLTAFNAQELEVIGVISDKSRLHSSYVGIPFFYRHEVWKLGIKVGVQPMIFMFASSKYEAYGTVYNEPYEAESEMKDIKFDRIDIGPKIGIDYRLNEKLRLRADYYHGLIDITPDEFPWQRKNRQINIGIQYLFGNNKLKE